MTASQSGKAWEEASSPEALRLARRFESDWRRARAERGPLAADVLAAYLDEADSLGIRGGRLALLRAEIGLRWEAGERVPAAEYLGRLPGLPSEAAVALIYEEFCLREEAGDRPDPADYFARFPEHAAALRRVLDIHDLVGSGATTTFGGSTPAIEFPEAGETIAGFRLVEELGRGAFARVFLAEERQLADRPVALKVTRAFSREPQALARLQHTHIVPVHSYRTDPATGLHLLCMPFFGRVTLGRLLGDPATTVARGGADLIDALDRLGVADPPPSVRAASRAAIAARSYPATFAWWGARLAEALDHAHGVGLLHRDVKPSNVLLTRDGLPMLLDFNLAREAVIDADDPDAAVPGGTLDYMAPEQLDELAEGISDRVGPRSDVFGLGVLLFEALSGARPYAIARGTAPVSELIARAAAERRAGPPRLRDTRPEVPSALAAVVTRCLAPEPADRYASAGDLAIDLQAVADDRPLRFAREPRLDRAYRWARRNRRALATSVPILVAVGLSGAYALRDRLERSRIRAEAAMLIESAETSEKEGKYEEAVVQYDAAARLADRPDLGGLREQVSRLHASRTRAAGPNLLMNMALDDLRVVAQHRAQVASLTGRVRADAAKVSHAAEALRFRLAGFGGDLADALSDLADVLAPFFVFDQPRWYERPDLKLLDDPGRARLFTEVNELMFLLALSYDSAAEREAERAGRPASVVEAARASLTEARSVCDRALEFAEPRSPWQALRARVAGLIDRSGTTIAVSPAPDEPTALGQFQWGLIRLREGREADAAERLAAAVRVEPGNYWYRYFLAYTYDRPLGDQVEALRHYDAALALNPGSPWVRFGRGRLLRVGGDWADAEDDLRRALDGAIALPEPFRSPEFEAQIRLELGLVRQATADLRGAREQYQHVIACAPRGDVARAARLNLAKLEADAGALGAAEAGYDAALRDDPGDRQAIRARALLAIRRRAYDAAGRDLTTLIDGRPDDPATAELLGLRGLVRLAENRPAEALADAESSLGREPSPRAERLRTRALLDLGRFDLLRLDDPGDLDALPDRGPAFRAAVRRLAEAVPVAGREVGDATPEAMAGRLNRAVALAWLGRASAAREAAEAAARAAPFTPRPRLVLARILRRLGRRDEAARAVDAALAIEPGHPAALILKGRLATESGAAARGRAELDRAISLGVDGPALRAARAEASLAMSDPRPAVRDWTLVLNHDPEDPSAYLGRARALLQLGQVEAAIADLEQAGTWAAGRPELTLPLAVGYARCLPRRPALLGRVVGLVRLAAAQIVAG